MALTITRDLQIAIALYTIGVERARRTYNADQAAAEGVTPPRTCPVCERSHTGASRTCAACRQRAYRDRMKEKKS